MGDAEGHEPDGVFNPWRRLGPRPCPRGLPSPWPPGFLLPLTGDETFKLLTIDTIVFFPLLLGTTALIAVILPRDQVSFAERARGRIAGAVTGLPDVLPLEHLLPWAAIQGIINLGIGIKQFKWVLEGPEAGGSDHLLARGWDFGIVFGILYFFMYLSSDAQVRGDVRLGRLSPKQFSMSRARAVWACPGPRSGSFSRQSFSCSRSGSIMQGILPTAGFEEFSVRTAVAFKTAGAILGTLAGCGAGVWWGRRKESALMEV